MKRGEPEVERLRAQLTVNHESTLELELNLFESERVGHGAVEQI